MNLFQERKQRWIDFLDKDHPRKRQVIVNCSEGRPEADFTMHHPGQEPKRIDIAMRFFEWQLANAQWLDDDTVPHVSAMTGTEIFAEAFGCPVERPDDNMPFAQPIVFSADDLSKIKVPKLEDSTLMRFFEIGETLRSKVDPEVPMSLVDIQSPVDVAALIWEKSDFYMAFIESPEAIRELTAKILELQIAFLDEWFNRFGKEFIAHYPQYYMPFGLTLSEDEVGVVNTEIFEDLYLPELQTLSRRYGQIGIHCCADSMHQWEGFKKIENLKIINHVRPEPYVTEALKTFEGHCSLWPQIERVDQEAKEAIYRAAPENTKFVAEMFADSRDEALQLLDTWREEAVV